MALEITGNLYKIMPELRGTSKKGEWVKQDFIIETDDQYPKKINITAWSEKVEDLKKLRPGDKLKVAFDVESREYNDKWYTDVKAWRIDKVNSAGGSNSGPASSNDGSYDRTPPPYDPASEITSADDLPF